MCVWILERVVLTQILKPSVCEGPSQELVTVLLPSLAVFSPVRFEAEREAKTLFVLRLYHTEKNLPMLVQTRVTSCAFVVYGRDLRLN